MRTDDEALNGGWCKGVFKGPLNGSWGTVKWGCRMRLFPGVKWGVNGGRSGVHLVKKSVLGGQLGGQMGGHLGG